MIQNYRDLKVWQKAMDIAEAVCRLADSLPKSQTYTLASQLQRSAISVPSNIAEGRTRHSRNDFIYHLNIARGSLAEMETQLTLSLRLGYIDEITHEKLYQQSREVMKMLHGLRDSLTVTSNLKPVTL